MLSRIMASDLGTMMFPVTWSGYLTLTMGNHISHMECLDPVQTLTLIHLRTMVTGQGIWYIKNMARASEPVPCCLTSAIWCFHWPWSRVCSHIPGSYEKHGHGFLPWPWLTVITMTHGGRILPWLILSNMVRVLWPWPWEFIYPIWNAMTLFRL